jgi:hypothetical protein
MKTEPEEIWVKQLTESISPPLSERTRQRALQGMAQVGPRPGCRRRRLMVMATAALAALVALGFVPVPMGRAAGALERALAAAERARTVHIIGTSRDWQDERWQSVDGFNLLRNTREGKLFRFYLYDPDNHLSYHYISGSKKAYEDYLPSLRGVAPSIDLWGSPEKIKQSLDIFEQGLTNKKLSEYHEQSLWGEALNVVEITGELKADGVWHDSPCHAGDKIKRKVEIEPETGYARSMEDYLYQNGRWQLKYQRQYEWNKPVPAPETYQTWLIPPPGTLLTRGNWWKERDEKVIAVERTRDFEMTLHSLDVNRQGVVFLSLSRARLVNCRVPLNDDNVPDIKVEARDNTGRNYTRSNEIKGLWVLMLLPDNSESFKAAKSMTLKVYPYSNDPAGLLSDQFVIFKDVPLPPRQSGDDLVAETQEKIQY